MDNIKWIVILIFVVVWVIGNLVRSQQEEPKAPPTRRPPNRNPNPNANPNPRPTAAREGQRPATPPVSDIDRFLQEIDRLRRRGAEDGEPTEAPKPKPKPVPVVQQPPPAPPKPVPPPPPGKAGRPAKQAKLAKMAKQAPTKSAPPSEPVRRPAAEVTVQAVPEYTIVGATDASSTEAKVREAAAAAAGKTTFPSDKKSTKPLEGSPAELLVALLKSKKGFPIAMVLAEILAEPKCKRKPGQMPQSS